MILLNNKFVTNIRLLLILFFLAVFPLHAQNMILSYEQVITDPWGNEIGYRTTNLSSPNDLPVGSPWYNYLNLRLPDGKTIYQYALENSKNLSKPLHLTISDRNNVSYTYKNTNTFDIKIYSYVNSYSSNTSKSFLFLHEFGHVAMLNAYPSYYDFAGLDYGPSGLHYLDSILPNSNTVWIEAWANAFAALNNNGMIFSIDLNSQASLDFLKNHSFEEMTRNELFGAKLIYDIMKKLPSGKSKVFDIISRTGPHFSLLEFCRNYLSSYPNDRVGLANIIFNNSNGKISLNEMLTYVNSGSNTVSQELYNFLTQKNMIAAPATSTAQKKTTTSTGGFFSKIFSFLAKLFGGNKNQSIASGPIIQPQTSLTPTSGAALPPSLRTSTVAQAPANPDEAFSALDTDSNTNLQNELQTAQEAYYQLYMQYNKLISSNSNNTQEIKAIAEQLQAVQKKITDIKSKLL